MGENLYYDETYDRKLKRLIWNINIFIIPVEITPLYKFYIELLI